MRKIAVTALVLITAIVFVAPAVAEKSDDASKDEKAAAPKVFDEPQKPGVKATCPVMGGGFTITEKTAHSEYKGKHVYFCCPSCKEQFDKQPEKYMPKE